MVTHKDVSHHGKHVYHHGNELYDRWNFRAKIVLEGCQSKLKLKLNLRYDLFEWLRHHRRCCGQLGFQ